MGAEFWAGYITAGVVAVVVVIITDHIEGRPRGR